MANKFFFIYKIILFRIELLLVLTRRTSSMAHLSASLSSFLFGMFRSGLGAQGARCSPPPRPKRPNSFASRNGPNRKDRNDVSFRNVSLLFPRLERRLFPQKDSFFRNWSEFGLYSPRN